MIISDLEDINPNFYPTPINQIPSNEPGIKNTFEKLPKNSYLTKKDFVKLYKKCRAILHSENPYGRKINYDDYYKKNQIFGEIRFPFLPLRCVPVGEGQVEAVEKFTIPASIFGYLGFIFTQPLIFV